WWAIIVRDTDSVIGAACVQNVANKAGAELEIGWRLATASTGHGYATEAGKAASDYAFDVISAAKVIAVADPKNIASHRVMERVGMTFRGIETHYDESCTTYVMQKPDRDG
uniref:GNAT family N-acetyltransferase n=1 Tax=Yoonia sp. TaxID=2212373 RepID=UPI0025EC362F